MKRKFAQWRFCFLIALIVIIYSVFFACNHLTMQTAQLAVDRTAAALAGVETLLSKALIPIDFSEGIVLRAITVSSTGYGYFIKQIATGRGRTLADKRANISLGFFFPIMVLLMFFSFYQSARASSGSEADPDF